MPTKSWGPALSDVPERANYMTFLTTIALASAVVSSYDGFLGGDLDSLASLTLKPFLLTMIFLMYMHIHLV